MQANKQDSVWNEEPQQHKAHPQHLTEPRSDIQDEGYFISCISFCTDNMSTRKKGRKRNEEVEEVA